MLGYWNRLSATRKALCGSSMYTGDQYVKDDEGYFWFIGRNDDCFKVNGMWVSPFEVEDVLLQHESVLDAAVLPSTEQGESLTRIVAFITLKSEFLPSTDLEQQIRQLAKSNLPHFKAPDRICFLPALPRTSTGKIHRQALLVHGHGKVLHS